MRPSDLALDLITSAPALVIDTETTGLDPHADRVCGWVFATAGYSVYIPVRHAGGGNLFEDPAPFERQLARAFGTRARLGYRTIGHNLPFDLWMAGKEGVLIEAPLEDTMLNEVLLHDDQRDGYDLDTAARRRGVPAKAAGDLYAMLKARFKDKGAPGRKQMRHFHKLAGDDPQAVEYAVGDGISTYALWEAQQPLLDADDLRRVWQLECALLPHLARMRRRGIRVDLDYAAEACQGVENLLAAQMMVMPPGFEANVTKSVRSYLESQGYHHFPKTATGKDSFREDWLLTQCGDAGAQVVGIRKLLKTKGTFLEPIMRTHNQGGRIYPELVQFTNGEYGTHTGRFSCRNPNLQAFPKRNKDIGKIVRPILVPDDGMDFGEADVSQQEPRLYAHYGNDEHLIRGYNASPPTDVHTLASKAMGINRDRAKTLGLSIFNGMQERSLAYRLQVPRLTAANLIEDFLDTFPGIKSFRRLAPQVAADRGHVFTIYGRRAYFSDPRAYYMAVSRIIQGSAADQMKLMMLRAFEYCDAEPRVQLLLSIHDSVMFQSVTGFDLTEFQRVLEDNSVLSLRVPMPVELKLGANWGQASYG